MELYNKNCLVMGFGVSGQQVGKLIKNQGGKVTIYSDFPLTKDEVVMASRYGFSYGNYDNVEKLIKKNQLDLMVLSPSIKIGAELVKLAKKMKVKVVSEVELGCLFAKGTIIGVTGTNGKSTTATLIGEMLKNANKTAYVLGNIGCPISEKAELVEQNQYVSLELSSYQLESSMELPINVAVVLNITKDHLERHKTFENYVLAKKNITKFQGEKDFLVLNYDDEIVRSFAKSSKAKVLYFSQKQKVNGAYLLGENILFGNGEYIASMKSIKLMGRHNVENILASITAMKVLKIPTKAIAKTLTNFNGIKHRLEVVKEIQGVTYVNDSKSTNLESLIVALECYCNRQVILIMGGVDSGFDYKKVFTDFKNLVSVVVYGENAEKIVNFAKSQGYTNIFQGATLKECVLLSRYLAKENQIVLLSNGSKSFDMFKNFEERGEKFREIVRGINEKR